MKRFWLLLFMAVLLVVLDQVTKSAILSRFYYGETYQVISGFFSLAYVQNRGAAFGFLNTSESVLLRQILFLVLPVIFCGWISFMFYKTREGSLKMSFAYSLILAGATGNLIDRFSLGFVVDFLMFYWQKEENHFHVFNVADSCITVAGALLIWDFIEQFRAKGLMAQQG